MRKCFRRVVTAGRQELVYGDRQQAMQSGISAPLKLISFQGNIVNDKISLQWTIDENENRG
jgi:hypothetical protein